MTRRSLFTGLFALALLLPALALAHTGHVHKVTGTVTLRQARQVQVRTQEGKLVIVTLNDKTTFERGTKKVTQAALEVGHRVVVDVGDGKEPLVARGVEIGVKEAAK